jgi:POT family proton-dependent oligopeptide transporter
MPSLLPLARHLTVSYLFKQHVVSLIDRDAVALSTDPRLVWNYASMAGLSGIGGILFWFSFRRLDREDAALDNLGEGRFFES